LAEDGGPRRRCSWKKKSRTPWAEAGATADTVGTTAIASAMAARIRMRRVDTNNSLTRVVHPDARVSITQRDGNGKVAARRIRRLADGTPVVRIEMPGLDPVTATATLAGEW
jgi:hypothetical protein